jgi:hypothetical protein
MLGQENLKSKANESENFVNFRVFFYMKFFPVLDKEAQINTLVIAAFLALNGTLLIAHSGKLLSIVFPATSLITALFLHHRNIPLYIGFTWWSWFFGILIRRMIDYYVGGATYGPWHLTPMLVTSVSLITLFSKAPKIKNYGESGTLILSAAVAVLYCAAITLVRDSSRLAFLGTLSWLSPIAFCFLIFSNWRMYPAIKEIVERSFIWLMLPLGSYGIYQYIVAPAWDCFYLSEFISHGAFGLPEPFGIRVFGTMDVPHAFGAILSVSILLFFTVKPNIYSSFGLILAFLSILLTSARTIWISLSIGFLFLFPGLTSSGKFKFIIYGLISAYLVFLMATSEPFSDVILKRVESLTDSEDASFTGRKGALYSVGLSAFFEVIGKGFGSNSIMLEGGIPVGDNGIFLLLFTLGLIGTIPYLASFFLLITSLFRFDEVVNDPMLRVSRSVVISTFCQIGFLSVMESTFAMILWGFLGVGLASLRYNLHLLESKDLARV